MANPVPKSWQLADRGDGRGDMFTPVERRVAVSSVRPTQLAWSTGEPIMLYGPGSPEGIWFLSTTDQNRVIDDLIANGGNTLYTMLVRSNGGDGGPTENVYVNEDPQQGMDPAKIAAINAQIERCAAADIIVLVFFYDDGSDPYNDKANDTIGATELQFIDDVVAAMAYHPNLIWAHAEESNEVWSVARSSNFFARVRSQDPFNNVIGNHQLQGTVPLWPDDPNCDVFICQNRSSGSGPPDPDVTHGDYLAAYANVAGRQHLGAWEIQPGHGRGFDPDVRQNSWAAMMAGATVMVLRWWGENDPFSRVPSPQQLGEAQAAIDFFVKTRFEYMDPDDARAAGESEWCMAEGSNSFICYSRAAPNNLGVTGLDAANYNLLWLDCVAQTEFTETVTASAGSNTFPAPGAFGAEIAVYGVKV